MSNVIGGVVAPASIAASPQRSSKKVGGVFTEEQLEYLEQLKEDAENKKLIEKQDMGKDQFMHILLKQLSNQNPLEPIQDKDFIAQMAQFSSLENMQDMNTNFKSLTEDVAEMKSVMSYLGKNDVELEKVMRTISTEISEINETIKNLNLLEAYSD